MIPEPDRSLTLPFLDEKALCLLFNEGSLVLRLIYEQEAERLSCNARIKTSFEAYGIYNKDIRLVE